MLLVGYRWFFLCLVCECEWNNSVKHTCNFVTFIYRACLCTVQIANTWQTFNVNDIYRFRYSVLLFYSQCSVAFVKAFGFGFFSKSFFKVYLYFRCINGCIRACWIRCNWCIRAQNKVRIYLKLCWLRYKRVHCMISFISISDFTNVIFIDLLVLFLVWSKLW